MPRSPQQPYRAELCFELVKPASARHSPVELSRVFNLAAQIVIARVAQAAIDAGPAPSWQQ